MGDKLVRKRSKIGGLPPNIRAVVEEMIINAQEYTYQDIVDYLRTEGFADISLSAVQRYAASYTVQVQMIKTAQEDFRMLNEEMEKYPDTDFTEMLIRYSGHRLMKRITSSPQEEWDALAIEKAIDDVVSLTRAKTYKKRNDIRDNTEKALAFDQYKSLIFDQMAKIRPDLYAQVTKFLNEAAEV